MDLVIGSQTNPIATNNLLSDLNGLTLEGTLYTAYPILATAEGDVTVDALLLSDRFGVIVFHFPSVTPSDRDFLPIVESEQDALYFVVSQKLREFKELRRGRELAVEPIIVSYLPFEIDLPLDDKIFIVGQNTIRNFFENLKPISPEYSRPLNAAIQRVSTIKPLKKRASVRRNNSKGAIIKRIESEIANLDRWQSHAAIESPEGPQCIRGLAGSGKTIVLALKAAYLHARNPDWNIAITFHTRSLYQQFEDLVRRFSYEHLKDEPNWKKLRIIHSWGSQSEPGIYSEIASQYDEQIKNFNDAKYQYGRESAFSGICEDLMTRISHKEKKFLFDVLLIDEAQDFPQSFFQLIYHYAVPDPHKIVWAYDELQSLGDYSILPPEELFGSNEKGEPLVTLRNQEGRPRQDIVLPVCYRNTPWALATAHALGFGIYRNKGLVQLFNDPSERVWEKIGYEVVQGSLTPNHKVSLARRRDAAPNYFYELLNPNDAVESFVADSLEDQAKWLTENVYKNLTEDELEPSDILIIIPNPLKVSDQAGIIVNKLAERGIHSHIAGITSSKDILFLDDSVAITGIFRAKGNEAPMVYVLNSQYGFEGPELIRRRNTLFTAITRSKAWVRVSGFGSGMEELKKEIDAVAKANYRLDFVMPNAEEIAQLKKIYRDITDEDRIKLKQASEFLQLIESGDLSIENVPLELREKFRKYFGK